MPQDLQEMLDLQETQDPEDPQDPEETEDPQETEEEKALRQLDECFKLLMAVPEAVRQLVIARLGAGYAAGLQFDAMTELPTERVSDGLKRLIGDARWLVPHADGHKEALILECQSRIDDIMEGRLTRYAGDALVGLRLTGEWKKGRLSPKIVTITVYNGDREWQMDGISWHAPAGTGADGCVVQEHLLLDMQRYADAESPEDVLYHALSRVERYPDTFWEEVRRLRAHYRGPEWRALRPRLGRWLWQRGMVAKIPGIEETTPNTIMEEDMDPIRKRWLEYEDRRRAEFRAEGIAEGEANGQNALLARLTARKFGAETAKQIAAACRGPGNGKRLEDIVDAIYECDSGTDLLARVERMS